MRAVIVAVACVAFGFAVYQQHIFNIYHTQVQFVFAGITIGIAYAFAKANRLRDGVAALVVWYVVLVGLLLHEHSFVSVRDAVYIALHGFGVYFFLKLLSPTFRQTRVARIASYTVIASLVNGAVIPVQALIHWKTVSFNGLLNGFEWMVILGLMIGVSCAVGMELAEEGIRRFLHKRHS